MIVKVDVVVVVNGTTTTTSTGMIFAHHNSSQFHSAPYDGMQKKPHMFRVFEILKFSEKMWIEKFFLRTLFFFWGGGGF